MAYNELLAERVRKRLASTGKAITEKKMFRGLAFLAEGKMCINVSGENLMCRFDPIFEKEVQKRTGYLPMVMKGKVIKGYCYVEKQGFASAADFDYWINLCLDYNAISKSSKRK